MYRKHVITHRTTRADQHADHGDRECPTRSPDATWLCTRRRGHGMPHMAGLGVEGATVEIVAEWDDNRGTDDEN